MMGRRGSNAACVPASGQALVVAGFAGLAGSLRLLEIRREVLSRRFSRGYLDELSRMRARLVTREADFWQGLGAAAGEESGPGGIFGTIWTLSEACGLGLEAVLRDIPVLQGTVEICECLECNPYRLYSAGCWLLAVADGYGLMRRLADEEIPARVIGRFTPGIARKIITGEGQGFLERPREDELLRFMPASACISRHEQA